MTPRKILWHCQNEKVAKLNKGSKAVRKIELDFEISMDYTCSRTVSFYN